MWSREPLRGSISPPPVCLPYAWNTHSSKSTLSQQLKRAGGMEGTVVYWRTNRKHLVLIVRRYEGIVDTKSNLLENGVLASYLGLGLELGISLRRWPQVFSSYIHSCIHPSNIYWALEIGTSVGTMDTKTNGIQCCQELWKSLQFIMTRQE